MDSATANRHLGWSHASLDVDEADRKDAPYFQHYSLDLRDERQNIRLLQMLPSAVGELRFTMFNNVFLPVAAYKHKHIYSSVKQRDLPSLSSSSLHYTRISLYVSHSPGADHGAVASLHLAVVVKLVPTMSFVGPWMCMSFCLTTDGILVGSLIAGAAMILNRTISPVG